MIYIIKIYIINILHLHHHQSYNLEHTESKIMYYIVTERTEN